MRRNLPNGGWIGDPKAGEGEPLSFKLRYATRLRLKGGHGESPRRNLTNRGEIGVPRAAGKPLDGVWAIGLLLIRYPGPRLGSQVVPFLPAFLAIFVSGQCRVSLRGSFAAALPPLWRAKLASGGAKRLRLLMARGRQAEDSAPGPGQRQERLLFD